MTDKLTPRTLAGLEVKKVEERSTYFNILFYGESGVGKTTLAGSASMVPEMSPVLVVDIEGGTESLKHAYPDVDVVRVTNWKDMQKVYDVLHSGEHEYKTVILDSLTEIQKFNMYNIMASVIQQRPNQDEDVPSMREWGINLEQMRRFVRAFRDLNIHTIFTALSRSDKDAKTGITSIQPSLSGKLAGEVAAFLDIVCYAYVKQIGDGEDIAFKRLLLTSKTESHVAKDRSGRLPTVIEDPTMAKLFDLMTIKKVIQDELPIVPEAIEVPTETPDELPVISTPTITNKETETKK